MEQRYQKYKDLGYQQYMVIGDAAGFGSPPTASYCKQIKQQYGLTFPVLYDPTGKLAAAYGYGAENERNFVFSQGSVIEFIGHYSSQSTVDAKIASILEP